MPDRFISRGFRGKRREPEADQAHRVPPGQYVVHDWPVLSTGPTPRVPLEEWRFVIDGLVAAPVSWTWDEFTALHSQPYVVDVHCVTKWTKLDVRFRGVSIDTLLLHVDVDPNAAFVMASSYGGYTTNIPLDEVTGGQAFVAYEAYDEPLEPVHGGPARLVVPHLYFWKSAKWVRGLTLMAHDQAGFWESLGYNMHGDPAKEQRYTGD